VTAHQGALSITESQISDLGTYLTEAAADLLYEPLGTTHSLNTLDDVSVTLLTTGKILVWNGVGLVWEEKTLTEAGASLVGHTHVEANITDLDKYTQAQVDALTWAANDIVSGTFDNARIAESNVTQHQAALSITESQISDLGTYEPALGNPASDGYILSSTAAGARSWIANPAGVTDHGALTGLDDDDHTNIYAAINAAKTITGLWEFDNAAGIEFGVSSTVWGRQYAATGAGLVVEALASMVFVIDSNNNSTADDFLWAHNDVATGTPTSLMSLTDEVLLTLHGTTESITIQPAAVPKISSTGYLQLDAGASGHYFTISGSGKGTWDATTLEVNTSAGILIDNTAALLKITSAANSKLELNDDVATGGSTIDWYNSATRRGYIGNDDTNLDFYFENLLASADMHLIVNSGQITVSDDGGTTKNRIASIASIVDTGTPSGTPTYGAMYMVY
jgi:hypothetical protein